MAYRLPLRFMDDLEPRKETILRAIVIEYVQSAEPIGSDALAQKYELGVRSATIRNEMADMAELGLLEQPHTSSGRVPSDLGYRYFVDRLIVHDHPESLARRTVQSASPDGDILVELLRSTAQALSKLTHLLSVATTTRNRAISVKTAVISALGPNQAFFVLVFSNGHVENRMLECPVGITLADVGLVNDLLQKLILYSDLKVLSKAKAPPAPNGSAAEKLLNLVWYTLRGIAKEMLQGTVITEGEEFMFGQPEFSRDMEALQNLVAMLSKENILYDAVASEPGRTVTIGSENRHDTLRRLSVVKQTFFVGNEEAGIIALVGPTRMNYQASIPLINYTAQALTDSLTKYFGSI